MRIPIQMRRKMRAAVERGEPVAHVARRLEVSERGLHKLIRRVRERGTLEPAKPGPKKPTKLTPEDDATMLALIDADPGITLNAIGRGLSIDVRPGLNQHPNRLERAADRRQVQRRTVEVVMRVHIRAGLDQRTHDIHSRSLGRRVQRGPAAAFARIDIHTLGDQRADGLEIPGCRRIAQALARIRLDGGRPSGDRRRPERHQTEPRREHATNHHEASLSDSTPPARA